MAEALYLEKSDLDCSTNNHNHHTADIGTQKLVVRRGQPFEVKLQFSPRGYKAGVDQLSLFVQSGPQPSKDSGTKAHIKVKNALEDGVWSAALVSSEGTSMVLSIRSPPNACIGHYNLTLETSNGSKENTSNLGDFYLIFNPWCPEDSVYLEREDERVEYVLCQYGIIFKGSENSIWSMPWNFGQFEDGILDICLFLLDSNPKHKNDPIKDRSKRNNPVYLSRVISAMVNCNDDDGVLYGRWDNRYADGVSPSAWNGSVDILQQWKKHGCRPVRYGQCWVFAAVACTIFRCLGIPCRVITNFYSAHDTNGNLVIEQYIDHQKNTKKSKDKIWNYHCWVESWMTRPDLGKPYNGWQVVDPTPQEKSSGVYCCGPAPVYAIKEGDLGVNFDASFVFAEVNADIIYYITQEDGSVKETLYTSNVGQKISTKSVGKDTRVDITHTYKYPEGSKEERRVYNKANQLVNVPKREKKPAPSNVTIKLKVFEGINKGNDFDVFAVINNNTDEEKMYRFRFCARTVNYTGWVGLECGMVDIPDLKLEAHEEQIIPMEILYKKYGSSMTEDNLIKLVAVLQDLHKDETILSMRDIHVKNPDIKLQVLGKPKQKTKLVAQVSLKNPLSEPLTGCSFTLEGAGLVEGILVKKLDCPVEPGEDAKVRVDLMPQLSGLRNLMVNFESDHLKGVKGFMKIIIEPFATLPTEGCYHLKYMLKSEEYLAI